MILDDAPLLETHDTIENLWTDLRSLLAKHGIGHITYLTVTENFTLPYRLSTLDHSAEKTCPSQNQFLTNRCASYEISRTGAGFLHESNFLTAESQQFVRSAVAQGFNTGLAIPMRLQGSRRFGGFNLGTALTPSDFMAQIWPRAEEFRSLCLIAHRRIEELAEITPPLDIAAILTPRETEIALLLSKGISRKTVAQECGISVNTVSEYAKSAYRKLGVHNRLDLARRMRHPLAQS
jgi:DNA-binding CsgD family transcriptional regulator